MFEWERIARASRVFEDDAAAASQSETLFRDSDPSVETGAQQTDGREGVPSPFSWTTSWSFSTLTVRGIGLEGAEPMVSVRDK